MGVVLSSGAVHRPCVGRSHSSGPEDGALTLDDGLARFDCTVFQEVRAGDHVLVLLELHHVEQVDHAAAGAPLVFHRSGFGKLERPT